MRVLKWVVIGSGGLLALLVIAALILTQLVDPNLYRGPIERQVTAATGRAFRLQGDIDLTFFPWLSLTTGPAALSSPPDFPEPQFLHWREAHVGVRLLPLLRGELVVDRVRLVGLEARLLRAADGRVNWAFESGATDARGTLPDIEGIELRDSQLNYEDATSGTRLRLDDLRLDLGPVRTGAPLRVEAAATVSSPAVPERASVSIATVVTLGPPLLLANTEVSGKLFDGRFAESGIPWRFAAPSLRYEPANGAVAAPAWELDFNEARIRGATTAALGDTPSASGTLSLAPVSLRGTLAAAGIELPRARDPDAYKTVKLSAGFRVSGQSLQIEPLEIVLDDTRLTGRVTRDEGVIRFSLQGDRMDLGRYLKPEDVESEPFVFPTAALKALRAEGTLDIDEATLEGVKMRGVRLSAGP